jgi:hypothetical protein
MVIQEPHVPIQREMTTPKGFASSWRRGPVPGDSVGNAGELFCRLVREYGGRRVIHNGKMSFVSPGIGEDNSDINPGPPKLGW